MATEQLAQVLAGRATLNGLPAAAARTAVVTCQYRSSQGAARAVRHFWYEDAPAWLASVPAAHPVHALIRHPVNQCPATLMAADAAGPSAVTPAGTQPETSAARPPEAALTRAGFSTAGLNNEQMAASFYAGDFLHVGLNREDIKFQVLFGQYLQAYGTHCDAYLPKNKVEMTRQVCAREQYEVNRYGARVGGSTCIEWRTEGTGIYADPALYQAKNQVDAATAPDTIREVFKTLSQKDPIGAALNVASDAKEIGADMARLVQINACNGAGLKRFQENLRLFALNKQPVRLAGDSGYTAPAAPHAPSGNQNYTKLLEDLVSEHAKTWVFNRYVNGSVSGVSVTGRDAAGKPARVTGRYLFNGRNQGSLTVSFTDGLPECMYFFDFPSTCRTPNRRVVAAFAAGGYQQ
ncbi:MAG: hypothetical protein ABI823_16425 [Bryobacteraceae bacterium]